MNRNAIAVTALLLGCCILFACAALGTPTNTPTVELYALMLDTNYNVVGPSNMTLAEWKLQNNIGSATSSAVYGQITGTISDQTDLWAFLTNHTVWIGNLSNRVVIIETLGVYDYDDFTAYTNLSGSTDQAFIKGAGGTGSWQTLSSIVPAQTSWKEVGALGTTNEVAISNSVTFTGLLTGNLIGGTNLLASGIASNGTFRPMDGAALSNLTLLASEISAGGIFGAIDGSSLTNLTLAGNHTGNGAGLTNLTILGSDLTAGSVLSALDASALTNLTITSLSDFTSLVISNADPSAFTLLDLQLQNSGTNVATYAIDIVAASDNDVLGQSIYGIRVISKPDGIADTSLAAYVIGGTYGPGDEISNPTALQGALGIRHTSTNSDGFFNRYALVNMSWTNAAGGKVYLGNIGHGTYWGSDTNSQDAPWTNPSCVIMWDGTNMQVNPKLNGTGYMDVRGLVYSEGFVGDGSSITNITIEGTNVNASAVQTNTTFGLVSGENITNLTAGNFSINGTYTIGDGAAFTNLNLASTDLIRLGISNSFELADLGVSNGVIAAVDVSLLAISNSFEAADLGVSNAFGLADTAIRTNFAAGTVAPTWDGNAITNLNPLVRVGQLFYDFDGNSNSHAMTGSYLTMTNWSSTNLYYTTVTTGVGGITNLTLTHAGLYLAMLQVSFQTAAAEAVEIAPFLGSVEQQHCEFRRKTAINDTGSGSAVGIICAAAGDEVSVRFKCDDSSGTLYPRNAQLVLYRLGDQ